MKRNELIEWELEEEWKPIKGYEEFGEISNYGLLHIFPRKWVKEHYTNGRSIGEYCYVTFKFDTIGVHRLVYETFIRPIPEGYDVHHINHSPKDNRVINLCLIDSKKHQRLHIEEKKKKMSRMAAEKTSKAIIQYTLDGEFVAEYPSAMEAERQTGIYHSSISSCCKNRKYMKYGKEYFIKSAGGYIWRYKE